MNEQELRAEIDAAIQKHRDFPTKGILFRDFLSLFAKPQLVQKLCKFIADKYRGQVDVVAGLEARGFLFGPIVALELGVPFVPIRKKGKLPGPIFTVSYLKEYGSDVLEMQQEVVTSGQRMLLLDDLLATGGSLCAAEELAKKAGVQVAGIYVVIELIGLDGRTKLKGPVRSLLTFPFNA